MSVIGVDYGNSDCVIAQAKRGGIDVVLNGNSNRKNPNMVCFQGKQRFMGESASSVASMHYKNNTVNIKQLIGRKFQDADVQDEIKNLAFKCVELPDGEVGVELMYDDQPTVFRCEQMVGMMMTKLKQIAADANEGTGVAYAVVSVPGYFSDSQRRGMLNACKIAGINCIQLMNEHAAVALSYGIYKSARNLFDEKEPQYAMFIDLGHSSYTVSVVAFVQGKLQVKSVAYDIGLGGRNFDMALAKHVAGEFQAKYKVNPLDEPKSRIKLLAACEKAKKNLSPDGVTQTSINVECLVNEWDYNGKVSLEEFEGMIAGLLDRLEAPIQQALKESGVEKSNLTHIEIVGGATRVSSVKRRLATILELDQSKPNAGLSTTLNADESIARGCALQCAILSPLFRVKEFHVEDILSYPVRVSWDQKNDGVDMDTTEDAADEVAADGDSIVIFQKSDSFPKTRRITFRRKENFDIAAAYAEAPQISGVETSLGSYTVSGIPTPKEGEEIPRIRVNVHQDIHGIFTVQSSHLMKEIVEEPTQAKEGEEAGKKQEAPAAATEPKKKRFRKVELKVEASVPGLTEQTINSFIERELSMNQQDRIIEETANKRNELETYIYKMRDDIAGNLSDFVSEKDRQSFEKVLQTSEDWLYSDEGFESTKSVYQTKLKELTDLGNPIEFRFTESSDRSSAASHLSAAVEEIKTLANSSDSKYSHWTDAERETLRSKCKEAENWLNDQLMKQSDLKSYEPPVVTCKQIRDKATTLRNDCRVILNKPLPKPAPEPKEEPKSEDAANGEVEKNENANAATEEPVKESMDLD